jgi:hypothetical protein
MVPREEGEACFFISLILGMIEININEFFFLFQRTGPPDPYGQVGGRANSLGRGMDEMDFSDDEAAPLTEPIYNGR